MSALTIVPSTMFALATVTLLGKAPAAISPGDNPPEIAEDWIVIPEGRAPLASFVSAIAALALMSASTMVPLTMFALAT